MAHIIYRPASEGAPAMQLVINGIDFSADVYAEGVELVDMSRYEGEPQVMGLRVTFALDGAEFGGSTPTEVSQFRAEIDAAVRAITTALQATSDRNAADITAGINSAAARGKRGRR